MDCKQFERMIPDFIARKLDFQNLIKFKDHMEHCADCKEELVIQFLVSEGMQRLEEGDAFDLQNELKERLEDAGRKIKFHSSFLVAGAVLEIAAVIALAGTVVWLIS